MYARGVCAVLKDFGCSFYTEISAKSHEGIKIVAVVRITTTMEGKRKEKDRGTNFRSLAPALKNCSDERRNSVSHSRQPLPCVFLSGLAVRLLSLPGM